MKYIVAVSGGVDSVALLDMLAKGTLRSDMLSTSVSQPRVSSRESWAKRQEFRLAQRYGVRGHEINADNATVQLIVAHFEHGIRGESSKNDALFVERLSQKYRVKCEIGYGNLTKNASEDLARQKRYDFLKDIAKKYDGQIVTAHHQDDLIETIAINLTRGTGWRGLAVFGDKSIRRPLLAVTKKEIYDYALKNNLEWVEDETNQTDTYLRNRLRRRLNRSLSDDQREKLVHLYENQQTLLGDIRAESNQALSAHSQSRFFFIMISGAVAMELLRTLTDARLTRPQLERMLLAIKTYAPGTTYEAGAGTTVSFARQSFVVTNTSQVL